ncbi:MAG: hypothetical protein DYH16_07915, partial [Nitrosomonas sp. PRO5]|nr:hypothetical protein [Nitrosomonas sp. PRO5]
MNIYSYARRILCLVFSFLMLNTDAQTVKNFSTEPGQWFKDMKEFLVAANKKDAQDLMEKFEPVWLQGKLTSDQQAKVIEVSNFMLK